MATFAAPVRNVGARTTVTPPEPNNTLGNRLMRHYQASPVGVNVFIINNTTVTENPPDGTVVTWDDVTHVFWGGHDAETITSLEATLLTAAGYTVT